MTGNWQIFECQPRNRSVINASVGIGGKKLPSGGEHHSGGRVVFAGVLPTETEYNRLPTGGAGWTDGRLDG